MEIIGHRGCSYKGYNQNTLRCYKKVIEQGCRAFEFDVQLTKDKQLVVVHNLNLEKVSNGKGSVRSKTLQEIKELYAGNLENGKDEIPTLSEVLELVSSYDNMHRPVMHLELKGDNTGYLSAQIIKKYLDLQKLSDNDFLISSFNWNELNNFKEVCSSVKIALLDGSIRRKNLIKNLKCEEKVFSNIFAYGEEDYMIPQTTDLGENKKLIYKNVEDEKDRLVLLNEVKKALSGAYYNDDLIKKALEMNAYSINLWYQTVSKEYIEKAHKNNLKVFLYTVNKEEDLERLKILKPDGIFTDFYTSTKQYLEK